jgi:hypothetical protein
MRSRGCVYGSQVIEMWLNTPIRNKTKIPKGINTESITNKAGKLSWKLKSNTVSTNYHQKFYTLIATMNQYCH